MRGKAGLPHRGQRKSRERSVQVPDGYLAVGLIAGAHGIRGEIKVESYSDFEERFAPGQLLYMGPQLRPVEIRSARPHKSHILVELTESHDRSSAANLRGTWLFVPEAAAASLDEDTYWVHDIVGLQVQTGAGQRLGVVTDVLLTGANEVYVVQTPPTVNQGQELLLPAIGDVVKAIDLEAKLITVDLLPGLLSE